jgi:hypothetical protein
VVSNGTLVIVIYVIVLCMKLLFVLVYSVIHAALHTLSITESTKPEVSDAEGAVSF